MRTKSHIAQTELVAEMDAITARFASLVRQIPITERGAVVSQMIGCGAAMLGAGISSSSDPVAVRKEVMEMIAGLLDTVIAIHAAMSAPTAEQLQ